MAGRCGVGVGEVRAGAYAALVGGKVLGAGRVGRGVEDGELGFGAVDWGVPGGESEEGADGVVEGVYVVYPVAPEGLNLGVGDCQLRHQLRLDSERTDHAVYTKQSSTYDTYCA